MKKTFILTFLLSLSILGLQAQRSAPVPIPEFKIDENTGRVIYDEVIQQEGSAQELYERALGWFRDFYTNPANVIRNQDAENQLIEGRGTFRLIIPDEKGIDKFEAMMFYHISIMARDGRYRFVITDINRQHTVYFGMEEWLTEPAVTRQDNRHRLAATDHYMQELIKSLKDFMEPEASIMEEQW